MTSPLPPTGTQYRIEAGPYRAVVTECGATLRELVHADRHLVDGFAEHEVPTAGRGQLLLPWPNRIRDGRYRFADQEHQLALSEPARHNASHGLVRWSPWHLVEHGPDVVELGLRLMAQSGYPWTLDLRQRYRLSERGLEVATTVRNRSDSDAPYAVGTHPYLRAGDGPVDGWELELPARSRVLTDDRLLPVGTEDVAGTAYDFTGPRRIGDLVLDDAFTGLVDDHETPRVVLRDPATGQGVELDLGTDHHWVQLFTGESTATPRRSLAVEPMTAPADAFNSGAGLQVVAPDASLTTTWRLRALGTAHQGA